MKVLYKGHEIEAKREKSLGGDVLVYWSIFRERDGYEVDSGFTCATDPVRRHIADLKKRVDEEIVDLEVK